MFIFNGLLWFPLCQTFSSNRRLPILETGKSPFVFIQSHEKPSHLSHFDFEQDFAVFECNSYPYLTFILQFLRGGKIKSSLSTGVLWQPDTLDTRFFETCSLLNKKHSVLAITVCPRLRSHLPTHATANRCHKPTACNSLLAQKSILLNKACLRSHITKVCNNSNWVELASVLKWNSASNEYI